MLLFSINNLYVLKKPLYINGKFLAQPVTGVQRFARCLVSALDRSLRAHPSDRDVIILLPPNAKQINDLQVIRQNHSSHKGRSLFLWEQVILPFEARKGDLICLTGSAPLLAKKCILSIHDAAIYLYPWAYSRLFVAWYRLVFRRHARKKSLVLTVSESSASDLSFYFSEVKFSIVPNSAEHIVNAEADFSVLKNLQIDPGCYLLAVGSLNPTKNFPNLIKAYTQSRLSLNIPLVIVGGTNTEIFREDTLIRNHPNLIWAGFVSDSQLRALYERALVFIFPSIYEGFGIPPLEAMHCGCPVIASNIPSVTEVCGDAAIYVDPFDGKEMLAKVESLLNNPRLRLDLARRGKIRSLAFSWDHGAERLRKHLAEYGFLTH